MFLIHCFPWMIVDHQLFIKRIWAKLSSLLSIWSSSISWWLHPSLQLEPFFTLQKTKTFSFSSHHYLDIHFFQVFWMILLSMCDQGALWTPYDNCKIFQFHKIFFHKNVKKPLNHEILKWKSICKLVLWMWKKLISLFNV